MFVFEFCGLPGTGKTTLCNTIEKGCRSHGIVIKNLQRIPLGFSWKERRINHLEMFLDGDCRKVLSFYKKCFGRVNDYDAKYWLLRIRQNILICKQWKKQGLEVATFDEGCVQFITSLFHGKEMSKKECEFAKYVFDIAYSDYDRILFDCKLDLSENVNRIRHRNRPGDRFLANTDEEIKDRLELKRTNLDLCISEYGVDKVCEIDMLDFRTAVGKAVIVTGELLSTEGENT